MTTNPSILDEVRTNLVLAWPAAATANITSIRDVGEGRGVFSRVYAVQLAWPQSQIPLADIVGDTFRAQPDCVVVKLPALGANRTAATNSGAYDRELLAYQQLLTDSPIATPYLFGGYTSQDGAVTLVLEDLSTARSVDQLDGLGLADANSVSRALGGWHHTRRRESLITLATTHGVRLSTPATFGEHGLRAGLDVLRMAWAPTLLDEDIRRFENVVRNRESLIERFERIAPSLCHGDVRADNLVFDPNNASRVVLFDWQQIAVQAPEADLAWLAATSLHVEVRRTIEGELLEHFAHSAGQDLTTTRQNYRDSLILPGLAVLFLAQRELANDRTKRFVATTLKRIAAALEDHDLA